MTLKKHPCLLYIIYLFENDINDIYKMIQDDPGKKKKEEISQAFEGAN